MGGGVMLNMLTFYYIFNMQKKPLLRDKFELSAIPTTQIDWRLLTGAALFGVGWGPLGTGAVSLFRTYMNQRSLIHDALTNMLS